MLAALGQHDAERARGDLRILEKQLVEIAHPVKQQQPGMGGLDVQILFHHRRDTCGVSCGRGVRGHGNGGLERHGAAKLAKPAGRITAL
jgi:hypothetical protein